MATPEEVSVTIAAEKTAMTGCCKKAQKVFPQQFTELL